MNLAQALIPLIFLGAYSMKYAFSNFDDSSDVQQLLNIHLNYCEGNSSPHYNAKIGEFVLPVLSLFAYSCISDYSEFHIILFIVVAITITLLLYKIPSFFTQLIYSIALLLFLDQFVATHLFRQIEASYILLIYMIRGRKHDILGIALLTLAFGIHLATFLIGILLLNFTQIYKSLIKKLWTFFLIVSISFLGFFIYREVLINFLTNNYGFAFIDQSTTVSDSFVNYLYKYISVLFIASFFCNKKLRNLSLIIALFSLIIMVLGENYLDYEIVFRLMVYVRYVAFPIILAFIIVDFLRLKFRQ
jgi:hypothetical protein